jgi:adenylosuccinate synthase
VNGVTALVGAQYGSEGKGTIAYHLARKFDIHVRTGAPNAGHTIRHLGVDWKMRSIPCGWVNPFADLVIGPGALVDLELLQEEVMKIEVAGFKIKNRLFIDPKAIVIDPLRHRSFEGGITGAAHKLIGSTGEGVGPARMAHMARGTMPGDAAWQRVEHVGDFRKILTKRGFLLDDTADLLNTRLNDDTDGRILLEGTQGCGLSLIHGPWPYVTSCDTNVTTLLADAGLAPAHLVNTILVARTFPIRVAGNSGPLKDEIRWTDLGVPEERTTVTQKVRRVGTWDDDLIYQAIRLNEPCTLALTFVDYLWPSIQGHRSLPPTHPVFRWIDQFEKQFGIVVQYLGTGPTEEEFVVIETPLFGRDV